MTENESDGTAGDLNLPELPKLVQQAIAMHEIMTSLIAGGWTERQAIIFLVESGRLNRDQ